MLFKPAPQTLLRTAIRAVQHWGRRSSIGQRRLLVRFVLLTPFGVALADDMIGQVSVIDGDTLEIHGTRIRLWSIDAPESTQLCRGDDSDLYRCGAQAANDLDKFIAGRPVSCNPINLDRMPSADEPPITGISRCRKSVRPHAHDCFGLEGKARFIWLSPSKKRNFAWGLEGKVAHERQYSQ
jgi:hypothetical protein